MPIKYAIDAARRIVYSQGVGVVTLQDVVDYRARLKADPAFSPSFSELFDMRAQTGTELSSSDVDRFADSPIFAHGFRRALVAGDGGQFGMARMYASMAQSHGHDVQAFRDHEAAVAWLADIALTA